MGMILLTVIMGYLVKDILFTKYFLYYFIVQSLLCFLLGLKIWKKLQKMKANHMEDKFKEFRRTDIHLWKKTRFLLGVTFLFPFRLFAMIGIVSSFLFMIVVLTIGHDLTKPLTGIRGFLYRWTSVILPRLGVLAAGYFKIKWVKNTDYDYTKWLGKGYKVPDYAVCTTSNHSAWTDLFMIIINQKGSSFVSKEEIKKVPLFGRVGKALNTIFFERGSSKEVKERALKQIQDRQTQAKEENGGGLLLHIFGEGFTTNNTHILPFKKGAFSLGLPVKPIAIKYSSAYFNPSHDIIPMGVHFIVLLSQLSNYCEVTELPVFEPNDYLLKTHKKAGEEDWVPFARAVQESIADVLSLPLSDASLKDKMECKSVYEGKADKDK